MDPRIGMFGMFAAACSLAGGCVPWRDDARVWAPEQAAIAAELATRARPIVAGDASLDVEPLWAMTRAARIVGIGEATHGTHEFRALMNAMVMRAAEDERPLVVALELGYLEGLKLDAWVGRSWYPPDPSLRERSFEALFGRDWLYATEDFRALFVAIREHNDRAAVGREIRVVGVDVCLHPSCVVQLRPYFVAVDPAYGERLAGLLAPLGRTLAEIRRDPAALAEARAAVAELRARLGEQRAAYVALRGEEAHAVALRLVWLVERRLDAAVEAESGDRDRVMADTVEWVAGERADARIMLLAHNGHITRGRYRLPNGRTAMGPILGVELGERFGADYLAVHTSFGDGSFLAHHTHSTLATRQIRAGGLRVFATGPAPAGTLEATLQGDGTGYALDVRGAAAGDGALARYLQGWHWTRSYGYAWKRLFAAVPVAWESVCPAEGFDVLVYFARGSATTPYGGPGSA